MSLPINLPNGMVSIYGTGSNLPTPSGMVLPPGTLYGIVDQVYDGGQVYVYGGDTAIFKESDVFCRLVYADWTYTLVEKAKLVTEEIPL